MQRLSLVLFAVALVSSSAHAENIDLAPVKKWIEAQQKVKSISATFNQERELRSLKRPLKNSGKFSYQAPSSFRWEIGEPGEPPKSVAVQNAGKGIVIAEPHKKKAKTYTMEEVQKEGKARGFSFLDAGFPRSFEAFDENFQVTEVEHGHGTITFRAEPRARKAKLVLRHVKFTINQQNQELDQLYLRFRDGSNITTKFHNTKRNASLPSGTFDFDLSGYEVEKG
ncbi:MAG: outer membrane lipoprotein carrier protein LolA [Verrucomicrobiota bacterium]